MAVSRRATGMHHRAAAPLGERAQAFCVQTAAWAAQHATWLSLAGALLLVVTLYGRALGFAFFFDEPLDLTRVEGRSYWSLLTSSEGYQYYRPIPLLIWKALHGLQGSYNQPLLHALPLVAHALTGWLFYLLLRRLGAGHWGLVPAVLFLTNPFHYQVVPMVSTVFHALVGAALLASLTLYLSARQSPSRSRHWLHLLALAATCIALWTHESGVAIAPLIVGLEAVVLWRSRSHRPSWWLTGHLAATALFLLMWATVEKAPNTEQTSLSDLHPNALFFLQGFTYPLSAQIMWLSDRTGGVVSLGLLQVGLLALVAGAGAYALAAWRAQRLLLPALAIPALAFGLAAATFLPALVRLSWGYVQDSPRLLYLPALGSALFWGLLPSLTFGNQQLTRVWRCLTLLLLAGVVAQSCRFIDVRMDMYAQGTSVIDQIAAVGDTYQGRRLLVVNAPSWFAQDRYEYPYGHLGVPLMPAYIGLDGVIHVNSRQTSQVDVRSVSWNADVSGGRFPFGPHGPVATPEELDAMLREGRELVTVTPQGDTFLTRDVGRLRPDRAERLPGAVGRVGDAVWLHTMRTAVTSSNPEWLTLAFTWNVLEPPAGDVDTVVEVHDERGQVIASYRGYALDGMSAPRLWQAGDAVADSIAIPIPASGTYRVWVGLQRVGADVRTPAFDADGERLPNDLVPLGQFVINADGTLALDDARSMQQP